MRSPPTIEIVGGVPLVNAIGTPRAIGETLGSRLKPRLQVLAQYLREQLDAALAAAGQSMPRGTLTESLRKVCLPLSRLEPGLWMELESMARAADLRAEDLLLIHGYGDLLSHYGCEVPPVCSTYVGLASDHTDTGRPRMVHVWHLDPALYPYITLVRRMPSHGPASLSLTLAGLNPVAGLNEAGLAACANELRVTDGADGHFTSHLLASVFTAPAMDDAQSRIIQGPRHGGAAVHLMGAGERISIELAGQAHARLIDRMPASPRVHTNHALDESILRLASFQGDPGSLERLRRIASCAVEARGLDPISIAGWFGLGVRDSTSTIRVNARIGIPAETSVVTIIDPDQRIMHLRRGGSPAKMESITL